MTSDYERIEAEVSAIREWAAAQERGPTDSEREQLNELSIQRASAYRVWQDERNRANAGRIVTGQQIFRRAEQRRQWKRWALVGGMLVLFTLLRVQRYADRDSVASDTYTPSNTTSQQTFSADEKDLLAMLPAASILPDGISNGYDYHRSLDEASNYSDDDVSIHRARLIDWDFQVSVDRYYDFTDATTISGADGLFDLSVTLTRYGNVDDATEAAEFEQEQNLRWMREDGVEYGYEPGEQAKPLVLATPLGDAAFALHQPYTTYGAKLSDVYLWVVDGPYLYEYWTVTEQPGVPDALVQLVEGTLGSESASS